jgi:hypothetical protein
MWKGPTMGFASLNPSYEPVNLLVFSISDLSQIKDLVGVKSAKTGKIHILYEGTNATIPA